MEYCVPMRVRIPNPIRRSTRAFEANPSSVGNAVRLIVAVVLTAVLGGSAVIWLLDRRDFPDYWTALWFTLQTVTTVGYGDVTPHTAIGRAVAGVVMLVAIAFVTVMTAAVTSAFVEAAQRTRTARDEARQQSADRLTVARLDEIAARLDRLERALVEAGPLPSPEARRDTEMPEGDRAGSPGTGTAP